MTDVFNLSSSEQAHIILAVDAREKLLKSDPETDPEEVKEIESLALLLKITEIKCHIDH